MNKCQTLLSPFDLDLINEIFDCALEWMHDHQLRAGGFTKSCNRERKEICYQFSKKMCNHIHPISKMKLKKKNMNQNICSSSG